MFGIGIGEIVILLLVAIVLIRPEDLPKALRSAGRLYGQLKRMYNDVIQAKDKIIKEIDDVATLIESPDTVSKTVPKAAENSPPKTAESNPPKTEESQTASYKASESGESAVLVSGGQKE